MTGKASSPRGRVLVVEDEDYVRKSLVAILAARGFEVLEAFSVDRATEVLEGSPVDVVLSDLRMPGADGLELLHRLQENDPELPVVILTAFGTVASAVQCLRAGASDYLLKPAEPDALEVILERAIQSRSLRREVRYLRSASSRGASAPIGESTAWRRVMAMVDAAAATESTVLLVGESGTGKELLARRIHELSPRASRPFIKVNCAAIPVDMWESEFFGHRKGSFTGADSDREGRFQLAHRGTLLLDEIGAMPTAGQAKLLRVIQDGEFDRLGDRGPTRVDVRIVASTNSDLKSAVDQGLFRADLFFRLNVLGIEVPPLRERLEDIPLLAEHFVAEISSRRGQKPPPIPPDTLARLRAYSWPGNVRELRNVLERALLLDPDPAEGLRQLDLLPGGGTEIETEEAPSLNLRTALAHLERDLIQQALDRAGSSRREAARLLGVDPRNLSYYLRKHGLEPGD